MCSLSTLYVCLCVSNQKANAFASPAYYCVQLTSCSYVCLCTRQKANVPIHIYFQPNAYQYSILLVERKFSHMCLKRKIYKIQHNCNMLRWNNFAAQYFCVEPFAHFESLTTWMSLSHFTSICVNFLQRHIHAWNLMLFKRQRRKEKERRTKQRWRE